MAIKATSIYASYLEKKDAAKAKLFQGAMGTLDTEMAKAELEDE